MRGRGRGLALGLALGLGLGLVAGCGGEDDVCEGVAGDYQIAVGPGTGDCDPDVLLEHLMLVNLPIEAPLACGRQVIEEVNFANGCSGTAVIEGTVTADGIVDAQIVADSDCSDGGASCRHSFALTLTLPDAGA